MRVKIAKQHASTCRLCCVSFHHQRANSGLIDAMKQNRKDNATVDM